MYTNYVLIIFKIEAWSWSDGQQLKAVAALLKDMGLFLSTHTEQRAPNCLYYQFRDWHLLLVSEGICIDMTYNHKQIYMDLKKD